MAVRARPRSVLVLVLALVAAFGVSLARPAAAIVGADPDWADGTPAIDGRVYAVAYLGGTVYIGGSFTSVNGTPRNRLAALNAADGTLLGWNPNANNTVRALKVSPAGTRVYAGGDFTVVGGLARARVAALSPSGSGAPLAWSPYVNATVKAVTTSNSGATVYLGGDFDSAAGAGRQRLAAFNATSGKLSTTFKPVVSNGAGNFATVLTMDVSANGDTLYFGGDFALVNGHARRNAAAVSTGVATLRAWSPSATADVVGELTVSNSGRTVFAGGRSAGGYAQAYGPNVGGSPVWNVVTDGDVEALAVSSSILYLGGHFDAVGGVGRHHLAALRAAGGGLENWNPDANGVLGAFAAAVTGSHLAFGGAFTTVGGESHQGVVQFSGTP
jgi:hypothetical protein